MDETRAAEEIIDACRQLHAQGLLSGADGNLSIRLDDRIVMTPSGLSKIRLQPFDMAELSLNGDAVAGKPSSEKLLHLEVYRSAAKARCVLHAHPPTAVAWSVARPDLREIPAGCLSEVIPAMGALPIVPYARPGTPAMAEAIRPYLPHHRAMILARHGAVTWGEDMVEALNGMERIEHVAKILKCAWELGGLHELPAEEIEALEAIRAGLGERLR